MASTFFFDNRELVIKVLEHLDDSKEKARLALVSSTFRDAVSHPSTWRTLDLRLCRNDNIDRLVDGVLASKILAGAVEDLNLEFVSSVMDAHVEPLLKHFRNLRRINLNGCQKVSNASLQSIAASAKGVKEVEVYWNLKVGDDGLKALTALGDLVLLNLSGCKAITDKGLRCVGEAFKSLESLDITRCVKLSDDGLLHVTRNCQSLRRLNVYAVSVFTDRSLETIGGLCNLTFLDLCGAHHLTDRGLEGVSRCRALTYLNLTWCVKVTDAGVEAIGTGCRDLELLSLHGILGVTDKSVELLATNCKKLKFFDVNGCGYVNQKSKDHLFSIFPALRSTVIHT